MKKNLFKMITAIALSVIAFTPGKSQVTLFMEDWSSSSFFTNNWTFPGGQGNWSVGSSYTPFGNNAPNAYFNWSPTATNYSFSLLSPTINATSYSGQVISLDYLLELNNFSTSTIEQFIVEYKDISASTWTTVNLYTNNVGGVTDYSVTNAVLAGMGGQNFQIRFTAFGANSFNINGWGLDSIVVNAASCPTVAPALSVNASSSISCSGSPIVLSAAGANTYTWNPGNLTGSSITVTPSSNTTYTVAGTLIGCTVVPLPSSISISTTPSPSVNITGISVVCAGQTGTMAASGAQTYSWFPSGSLNSSASPSVIATPTSSTIYTVIGTAANGCSNTASHQITVNQAPTILTLTASPNIICPAGGSSQLNVNAAMTSNYTVTPITYSPIPTPAGATTLCMGGTTMVPLTNGFSLDDGDWENLSIPFTFNFYGSNYTSFALGTNGFFYPGNMPNTYTGYGTSFPDPFSTTPCIAPMYADLDFSGTGTIEYFTTGVTPNQKLVINYINGQYYSQSGSMGFQLVICETSNIIEVHTYTATGDNPEIEAIQDSTGTNFVAVPGRNGTNYTVSTPDAYRFGPVTGTPTYSWSPATFLSSTSVSSPTAANVTSSVVYSVTATILGCSTTGTIALTAGSPTISVVATPSALCSGSGSVNITANGVSTYSWSTGSTSSSISVSPSVTTTYSVTGYNTPSCTTTQTISIAVGAAPTISITAGSGTVCAGGSTGLTASGATTYTWNTGSNASAIAVTPSVSTVYTVSGSNGGCLGTATTSIFVNSLPTVNISAAQSTVCVNGPTVGLNGSPAGGVYTGSNVAGSVFTPGANAGTFTPGYNVTNTVTGCSNTAYTTIIVSTCVGIEKTASSSIGAMVYPNPNTGMFTIELNNGEVKSIELSDLTGRVILSKKTSLDKTNMDISGLASGIYLVKIQSNGATEMIKVIKE